ncbi:MAG: heavy-metal-associated domain-containing protein [Desulfobulbaceae bacterium]|nr:heavy-metal-associated domain-containing protein [Desulfobulbaceae bacterium]
MGLVKVKGMSCQHCVASTKKALEEIPGVTDVKVDLAKGEATYQGDVGSELLEKAIVGIGFEVEKG